MTKIKICYLDDNIIEFECKNHSGFAEYGKDIVCAGISSITQTAVLGVQNIAAAKCDCKIDAKQGRLHFKLLENKNSTNFAQAQVVLKTMVCGLQDLQNQYPKYLKMEVK